MAKSGITLKFEGFEELLKNIEASGRSINSAVDSCMKQSAQIAEKELKTQMRKSRVPDHLTNAMPPPEIEWEGNKCTARVGYKKGAYDPENPSDAYKVIFLNYGTPHRKKYGNVAARSFIVKAKKKAAPQIKKAQKEALEKILERLKNK